MMRHLFFPSISLAFLAGCAGGTGEPIMSSLDPSVMQAMTTRSFATANRPQALRAVIATFQDEGYNIDKVNAQSGNVIASKAAALTVTVDVLPGAGATTSVHADALVNGFSGQHEVDDPAFYANFFFEPLARNLPLAPVQTQATTSFDPAATAPPRSPTPLAPEPGASGSTSWHESPSP